MMSDGTATLTKFFPILPRAPVASIEDAVENHSSHVDSESEVEDDKQDIDGEKQEFDDDKQEVGVAKQEVGAMIEYEDFLKEFKTSKSDIKETSLSAETDSSQADVMPSNVADPVDNSAVKGDNSSVSPNSSSEDKHESADEATKPNSNNIRKETTLDRFFTFAGKAKLKERMADRDAEVHPVEKVQGETIHSEEHRKSSSKKNRSSKSKKETSVSKRRKKNKDAPATDESAEAEKTSAMDTPELVASCEEEVGNERACSVNETSPVEDVETEPCVMNTSSLSNNDVRELINNSLVEAGIIQVDQPSLVVLSDESQTSPPAADVEKLNQSSCELDSSAIVCKQVASSDVCVDSPASSHASSQGSRISLRDVKRRLRERKALLEKVEEASTEEVPQKKKEGRKRRNVISSDSAGSPDRVRLRRRSNRNKSTEIVASNLVSEQTTSTPKCQVTKLRKVKIDSSAGAAIEVVAKKSGKSKRQKKKGQGLLEEIVNRREVPGVVDIANISTDDDSQRAPSSQSSTPVRVKRRRKRVTPTKDKKKRRVSDEDVIMVSVSTADSPSTKLREERLARLHAMSTEDDFSNLKQSKTTVSLTQAELFPRISHITQLPQDEKKVECRLKLLPTDVRKDIVCRQSSLGLDIRRDEPLPVIKQKKSKLTNWRIKKELKKLQSLLPHYPVDDVYDLLDSRATEAVEGEQLWTSKYSPSSLSQLLVRKGYVEVVNEWLLSWKRDIVKGQSSFRKKVKKKSSKKRNQFINDSDSEESEDEWTQTPILVISGSPGLGKTTCAYTIATILGYKVFEMNPSMLRTTKTVMDRVHESTRSQQVQKGKGVSIDRMFDSLSRDSESKPVRGIASFFTQIKKKNEMKDKPPSVVNSKEQKSKSAATEETADSEGNTDGAEAVSLSKLSLILFDEADVAFEDDKGFYETIKTLGLEAKKPIILTCQSTGFLRSIGVEHTHVEITPHIDPEIAVYLCIVSLVENEVADFTAMLQLVNKFKCDIRKCLLQIQYLITSGGLQSPCTKRDFKKKSQTPAHYGSPVHQLARMCRHQSTLDIISTHHHRLLFNGSQSITKLTSNPSKVSVDTGVVTKQSADLVAWSSVSTIKSTYTELLKHSFSLPKSKRTSSSELLPARVILSVREELPPYIVSIPDIHLCLDFMPSFKAICVTENERRDSKLSRRFLHYLAKQGLYLSANDQASIIAMFDASNGVEKPKT